MSVTSLRLNCSKSIPNILQDSGKETDSYEGRHLCDPTIFHWYNPHHVIVRETSHPLCVSFPFVSTSQVSKAAADLMAYCDAHIRDDPLIMPVPASENPFREKKFFCSILWWAARSCCMGAGMALPVFSVFTTPEATGRWRWVEVCQVDTLLLVSSVLVAEGFGGVNHQTGNPMSVPCLVK